MKRSTKITTAIITFFVIIAIIIVGRHMIKLH
ncbi:MAG TPA: efflux RND transporter periplasmic adaptor subunit, partial [Pelagibacteraceae bacterium]|nr:efflux RND transporter periplasmic adaptor subunit [Pelagibacteraceae bacterium]